MIPEGWNIRTIETIAKVSSGGTPSRNKSSYWNGDVPWITTTEVQNCKINKSGEREYISEEGLKNSSTKYVPENTILLAMIGQGKTRGQVAFLTFQATTNQNCATITFNDESDPTYYFNYLLSQYEQIRNLSNNAGQSNLSGGLIKSIKVPVPPLYEQTKIANILSTWDKAIETVVQLIKNSRAQKKALMQQLLTGKKRFAMFKTEWVKVHISDIAFINPGKPKKPRDGLVSFLSMDAVSVEAKLIRTETKVYEEVEKGFTTFIDSDVLIAKITPCFENGKGAYLENLTNGVGFGSTEFHVLRAKIGYIAKYIYYLTNTYEFRSRGEANMQGSAGQKRVSTDYLKTYKLRVPKCSEEQNKISLALSTADREIETQQQKLIYLKHEKRALMQQLLTGKRRVKIDTENAGAAQG